MLYYTDVDTGQQTPYPSTVVLNDGNGQPVQAQPTITAQTDSDITLSVPAALTAGSYSLVVTTSIGWTTSTNFTVGDPTPSISSVTPGTWLAGLTTNVTVQGSGFGTSPQPAINDGNVTFDTPVACAGYSTTDTCFTVNATVAPSDPGGPYNLTVTSQGYGGSGFFSGGSGNPAQSLTAYSVNIINISTGLAPATASSVDTNLISPPTMDLSTGDTATQVVVTTIPSNFTFTPVFTFIDSGNPTSSDCNATLSFSQSSGSGSVNSTVTASPAGCSGVFNGSAAASPGSNPSNELQIVVPPQIMIQTEVGEAGRQTAPGDASMPALLLVAENRFGDSDFKDSVAVNGCTPTYQIPTNWQNTLVPCQFYGASNTTSNGVQPELTYAAEVFAGTTNVSIPEGCEGYWSPTNAQYAVLQTWANLQAVLFQHSRGGGHRSLGCVRCWEIASGVFELRCALSESALRHGHLSPGGIMFLRMPAATVGFLRACCATIAAAMGAAWAQAPPHFVPEPRSGIWEAHSGVSGQDGLFVLTLTAGRSRDAQGAPRFRYTGTLRAPDGGCGLEAIEGASNDNQSLSADCLGPMPIREGSRLTLRFDREGQEVVATWWRDGKPTALNFERLPQDPNTRLEGDWVSEPKSFQQCVLHLYHNDVYKAPAEFKNTAPDHLMSTIDVYSADGSNGRYGVPISFGPYGNSHEEFSFTYPPANDSTMFVGRLDTQSQRIIGTWTGHMCGTFSRVRGDHKQ
jgi:hypothetical protein